MGYTEDREAIKKCSNICDDIVQGNIGIEDALDAFVEALRLDQTEFNHAAHIRDTIRENFDESDLVGSEMEDGSGTIEQALDNCREIVRVTPSITQNREVEQSKGNHPSGYAGGGKVNW